MMCPHCEKHTVGIKSGWDGRTECTFCHRIIREDPCFVTGTVSSFIGPRAFDFEKADVTKCPSCNQDIPPGGFYLKQTETDIQCSASSFVTYLCLAGLVGLFIGLVIGGWL